MTDHGVLLLQLPLHPGCAFEPTGNVPLAPGRIAAAGGLPTDSVVPVNVCDTLSDTGIISWIARRKPDVVGFTLYMWNAERSAWLSREIRNLLPNVLTIAGGPEVTRDNGWLRESGAFHLLVEGEGEPFAARLCDPVSLAREGIENGGFLTTGICTFPPDHWPDPYFTGHLECTDGMPAHVETVRGCPHGCVYCSYRRISPEPRIIPATDVLVSLRRHRDAGRSELVFLDPTFNGRADLPVLLDGMRNMGFSCFAEVRAGLRNLDPGALSRAGFGSVEVGLQTMNRSVLKAMGRLDDPERTVRGALKLKAAGVEPVLDLILGLPGDYPANILKAGERLVSEGLGENVQAFYLSVLPGTRLRADAAGLGLECLDRPPYWVDGLPGLTMAELSECRYELGSILGYDLDMEPRPVLCDTWPDTVILDTRHPVEPVFSGRHAVLRVRGGRLWENREMILSAAAKRFRVDPYCMLDVVLEADEHFPVDLLRSLAEVERPSDYHERSASVLGRQGRLRTAVLARADANTDWLTACATESVVVIPWDRPDQLPVELLERNIGLLFKGFPELSAISETFSYYKEQVFFSELELERLWCLDILELG